MTLNNFKINSITVSNLYKEGITISKIPSKNIVENDNEKIDKKTIVIVLNTAVNRAYIDWFEKVLAYCKLSINDVTIMAFNIDQNIEYIQATFNPAQIWIFGISSSALGMKSIKTIHFEIAHYNNLICLPLPRIETFFDTQIMKEHKRALMYILKKLFQII